MNLYVATGITSSLFAALLPHLSGYNVVGSVRELTLPSDATEDQKQKYDEQVAHREYLEDRGVALVNYDGTSEGLGKSIDSQMTGKDRNQWRILWFSSHDDQANLLKCANYADTIAIGSGAMVDFYLGKIDLTTTQPGVIAYIQSKLRMALTPGVTLFCPGFYVEDDATIPRTPGGLHHDTQDVLLKPECDVNFNWGKAKYITLKSELVRGILQWIANSSPYLNKWYLVGTERPWQRWELREAMYKDVPQETKDKFPTATDNVYAEWVERANNDGLQFAADDDTVKAGCKRALEWNSNNVSKKSK